MENRDEKLANELLDIIYAVKEDGEEDFSGLELEKPPKIGRGEPPEEKAKQGKGPSEAVTYIPAEYGPDGREETDPLLLKKLEEEDEKEIMKAVKKIREVGTGSAVLPVSNLLMHRSLKVKCEAVVTLGCLDDPRAAPPLVELLGNDDLRDFAFRSLRKLGTKAVPELVYALHHKDRITRFEAVRLLEEMKDIRSLTWLIRALTEKDKAVRKRTASAIMKFGKEAVWDAAGTHELHILLESKEIEDSLKDYLRAMPGMRVLQE